MINHCSSRGRSSSTSSACRSRYGNENAPPSYHLPSVFLMKLHATVFTKTNLRNTEDRKRTSVASPQPGESKTVLLTVTSEDLSVVEVGTARFMILIMYIALTADSFPILVLKESCLLDLVNRDNQNAECQRATE